MKLSRRHFLRTSAMLAAAPAFAAEPAPPMNVVVLMSDEHNPKVASPMGHPHVHTPNLERLARDGVVFENAYCPSPLCLPSRSAWLSGRRVHDIQCYNNCNVFIHDYPTLGGALAEQGVHSVLLGKTDVFRVGADLGFSECILPHDRAQPGDLNSSRNPLSIRDDGARRAAGFGPRKESPRSGDDEVVEASLEWLRTKPKTLDKPFVMISNITMPHFPHYVTEALWAKYEVAATLPAHGVESASAQHPHAEDLRRHFQTDAFTEEQIRGHRRAYLGCVEYVDSQVGKFLGTLEQEGLLENTLFVYTSDHGEMLGKFGMWWKCSLYEDSVHIPLYVMGKPFLRGARCSTPVDLHDLQATLFAATQLSPPEGWCGSALQEFDNYADESRVVFSEYHGHGTRGSGYLVRQGDWKYLWYADAPAQLFNLQEDPEELNNLASRHPRKVKGMDGLLRDFCDPEKEHARAEAFIGRQMQAARDFEQAQAQKF